MIRVNFGLFVALFCTALMGAELSERRYIHAAVSAVLAILNLSLNHVRKESQGDQ